MLRSVGLDLEKGWIKVVEISSDLKLTNIGRIRIPKSDREDTRNEQELYAAKINELFSNLKLTRENVVSNIRGSYILARTYLPPSRDKDEFERWFVKSIESIIPGTPIEEVVYSYELLPSGRALIAFARRKEIEKQLEMLKSCNIIPVSVDASCLALYDAFSPHPWIQKKENVAILDIGTYSTGVLIIKDGEAFGSNAMSLGGKDLIKGKDRANKFALDMDNDLAKIFTFYEKKENLRIQNIIITGKYATIPGLRKNLATKFNYTVELGDPFSLHKIVLPKKQKVSRKRELISSPTRRRNHTGLHYTTKR
jgi:Tfp pilus assembly PilM family ATPase